MNTEATPRIDPHSQPAHTWAEPFVPVVYLQNGFPLSVHTITGKDDIREAVAEHTGGASPEDIWGGKVKQIVFVSHPSGDAYGMGRDLASAIDDANEGFRAMEYTLSEFQ